MDLAFITGILMAIAATAIAYFTHQTTLDTHGKYRLLWLPTDSGITFEIQVETSGWAGLGFSTNGRMKSSDIVMTWATESGEIYLDDRHGIGHKVPLIDASQDYTMLGGAQNDTHLVVKFSRPWDTCDNDDMVLGDDTVRVIWAYHRDKPRNKYHMHHHNHKQKGSRSLHLKEKQTSRFSEEEKLHLKQWELRGRNVRLPNDDHTHYFCQIFRAPNLLKKHHMVGFEPIIHAGHENFVHHMVLYECQVLEGDKSEDWFERHSGAEGAACYSPNMPQEWSFCLATNTWAWAVGSYGERLPDHVGLPMGEKYGGATYFMLETHYDNPAVEKDLVDTSGMRIFYTDKLREHDGGMLLVGTEVNFLHMIPPAQANFVTLGRCTSECTSNGLAPEGVKLISGVLHSHLAGRKIKLKHVRNGQELPIIMKDNNYDFNFQSSRTTKQEVSVLPGDELLLECEYSTVDRKKPTFGGLSTTEEMCLGFMMYYPRRPLADCRSLPALETVLGALGINEMQGETFHKLVNFMKAIGRSDVDGAETLVELLTILYVETTHPASNAVESTPSSKPVFISDEPLSEEELLKKPFYTVEAPVQNNSEKLLNLPQGSNYRNLMLEMLLNVRIKSPRRYENRTLQQHLKQIDWKHPDVAIRVQEDLYFGKHSSVCLAHGRRSIIPYDELNFPFLDLNQNHHDKEPRKCRSSNGATDQPAASLVQRLKFHLKHAKSGASHPIIGCLFSLRVLTSLIHPCLQNHFL